MINDKELLKEWEQDELNEARALKETDILMQTDFDYALKHLGFSEEITVAEFAQILRKLEDLGYEISANELIGLV